MESLSVQNAYSDEGLIGPYLTLNLKYPIAVGSVKQRFALAKEVSEKLREIVRKYNEENSELL